MNNILIPKYLYSYMWVMRRLDVFICFWHLMLKGKPNLLVSVTKGM